MHKAKYLLPEIQGKVSVTAVKINKKISLIQIRKVNKMISTKYHKVKMCINHEWITLVNKISVFKYCRDFNTLTLWNQSR